MLLTRESQKSPKCGAWLASLATYMDFQNFIEMVIYFLSASRARSQSSISFYPLQEPVPSQASLFILFKRPFPVKHLFLSSSRARSQSSISFYPLQEPVPSEASLFILFKSPFPVKHLFKSSSLLSKFTFETGSGKVFRD